MSKAAFWSLMLLALHPPSALASLDQKVSRADSCISISAAGRVTRIVNNCEWRAFVGYCRTDKPISGKRCGQRTDVRNPYFTHITSVEPGTTSTIGHPHNALKFAPCLGSPKNFSSGTDGNYSCSSAQPEQLAWAHAVGRTEKQACERARSMVQPSEIVNVPCECSPRGARGTMFHCAQALSIPLEELRSQESFIKDIQNWIRKKADGKNEDCKLTKCAGAIGVRG